MVPKEPVMLLSYLNTLLRDRYPSFLTLCEEEQLDGQEIISRLAVMDYTYDQEKNQFI